jgi:hypothetical protein
MRRVNVAVDARIPAPKFRSFGSANALPADALGADDGDHPRSRVRLPAGVTWGGHVGAIAAGGLVGAVACDPRGRRGQRQTLAVVALAAVLVAARLLATRVAARHTVDHGPILIGAAGPTSSAACDDLTESC